MKIAITGGIGSGKSTVISALQPLMKDYVFASVDDATKAAYGAPENYVLQSFLNTFGASTPAEMSDLAFDNPAILARLEALVKPYIEEQLDIWLRMPNVVIEFPLLYREDLRHYIERFDLVISVTAEDSVRIARVKDRNSFSQEKIEKIIKLQPSQSYVNSIADIVFETDLPADQISVESLYDIIMHKEMQLSSKTQARELVQSIRARNSGRVGLVPGSFDPIQKGHLYVIQKALSLVDIVRVVIGTNDAKIPSFNIQEKITAIKESILEVLGEEAMARIRVDFLSPDTMLITHAQQNNAKFIFRGLRSGFDFDYESNINAVQRDIDPSIETIYIMTPSHLTQVSSSIVKSLAKFPAARKALQGYVTSSVLKLLQKSD